MGNAIASKLELLRENGLNQTEVAILLGTRPEQVSRWNNGQAYPRSATEKALLELEFIVEQLRDFYEPDQARQWLFSPQRLLNGEKPSDLIKAGRTDEVRRLVDQLRDGVYL